MQKISCTKPSKAELLEVTPNILREIANNLEKESQSAESKEAVVLSVNNNLSFIYYPKRKLDTVGYGSNREEPAYIPQSNLEDIKEWTHGN